MDWFNFLLFFSLNWSSTEHGVIWTQKALQGPTAHQDSDDPWSGVPPCSYPHAHTSSVSGWNTRTHATASGHVTWINALGRMGQWCVWMVVFFWISVIDRILHGSSDVLKVTFSHSTAFDSIVIKELLFLKISLVIFHYFHFWQWQLSLGNHDYALLM